MAHIAWRAAVRGLPWVKSCLFTAATGFTDVKVLDDEYNGQDEVVDFTLVPDDWSDRLLPE